MNRLCAKNDNTAITIQDAYYNCPKNFTLKKPMSFEIIDLCKKLFNWLVNKKTHTFNLIYVSNGLYSSFRNTKVSIWFHNKQLYMDNCYNTNQDFFLADYFICEKLSN